MTYYRWLLILSLSTFIYASQPMTRSLSGVSVLSTGEFNGTQLTRLGHIQLGYQNTWLSSIPGPISAMVKGDKGILYVATAQPAKVWQVQSGQEAKVVFENDKPMINAMLMLANGELAIVTGPEGGVHFVKPSAWDKVVYVEVPQVNLLLGAQADKDSIYLVGGGESGELLKLSRTTQKIETLASVEELYLKSILMSRSESSIYLGGGEQGVVYHYQNGAISSIYSAGPSEVTSMVQDKKGRVFAALKEAQSSSVIRIDEGGKINELWRSSKDAAYVLAIDEDAHRILVGTGANGLLLGIDADGKAGAEILLSQYEHRQITTLLWNKPGQLLVGNADESAIYMLDFNRLVSQGEYLTSVIDMASVSTLGSVLVNGISAQASVRVGNTPKVDDTWTAFGKTRLARYAQIKIPFTKSQSVDQIRVSYLPANHAPRIEAIRVLPAAHQLSIQPPEVQRNMPVTLEPQTFSNLSGPVYFAPSFAGPIPAQIKDKLGERSIYVVADDPDDDQLRYRFTLEKQGLKRVLKDWSTDPVLSFDTFKTADGRYQIKVEVDDLLTNGPARFLKDESLSDAFVIANSLPLMNDTRAKMVTDGVHVYFKAESKVPLVLAQCSVDGKEWIPIDPKDGMTDSKQEIYDLVMPGQSSLKSVTCEVFDEADNCNRVDIPYEIE